MFSFLQDIVNTDEEKAAQTIRKIQKHFKVFIVNSRRFVPNGDQNR